MYRVPMDKSQDGGNVTACAKTIKKLLLLNLELAGGKKVTFLIRHICSREAFTKQKHE